MSLDALFQPASIAVYGASAADSGKLGNVLLANAASGAGEVLAVHPEAESIDGIPALNKLDRATDLVLISVPAQRVQSAVEDAAAAGARSGIILTSGFGETGEAGRIVQDRIVAIASEAGMRLVGPNCMGVVSHIGNGRWLNGSYFWAVPDIAGGLSFVSQSGAFGGMFFAHLRDNRLGLSRFLSVGNAADVSLTDALEWLGEDDQTTAIGMFIEGIEDGRHFVEVARKVTRCKPVVVLKAGKMAAGARAAVSHTGSMAGTHSAVQAGFRRAGVIETIDTQAFFDALDVATAGALAVSVRNIAIVTISGGPCVLAADAAERAGLVLPALGEDTVQKLSALAPSFAALGNPIDLTPQCPVGNYIEAISAVYDDDAVEGVVAINCGLDIPQFGAGIVRGVKATGKPTTAFILDVPGVEAELAGAGILRFGSPERAVAALALGSG